MRCWQRERRCWIARGPWSTRPCLLDCLRLSHVLVLNARCTDSPWLLALIKASQSSTCHVVTSAMRRVVRLDGRLAECSDEGLPAVPVGYPASVSSYPGSRVASPIVAQASGLLLIAGWCRRHRGLACLTSFVSRGEVATACGFAESRSRGSGGKTGVCILGIGRRRIV